MRRVAIALLMSLVLFFGLTAGADTKTLQTGTRDTAWISPNPYAAVDWSTVGRHRGDLHTHTTESDGSQTPAQLIDGYKALGYGVLAVTDHDAISGGKKKTTWPWTAFGRNPRELGMIAIEGSEISRDLHHILSLSNDYAAGDTQETVALNAIRDRSGVAIFAHPNHYNYSLLWYKTYFESYPQEMLVGMEVAGTPGKWDNLLTWLMPDRPIWGFGNTDTHGAPSNSRYNTFLLQELSDTSVRNAIVNGQFTFSLNPAAPQINSINVKYGKTSTNPASLGNKQNSLFIESITVLADNATVRWISRGQEIHVGPTINVTANSLASRYVRAEITQSGWPNYTRTTYTQPFAVPIKGDDTKPALFDPMVHVVMPKNTAFADDFESGVFDKSRYTKSGDGTIDVARESSDNHALKFVSTGGGTTEAVLKDLQFGDGTIETDIRHDEPVVHNYASLRFRRAASNTYYEVRFERQRHIRLLKRVAASTTTLRSYKFPQFGQATFMDGKPHRLKVEVAGARIRVFFDGNKILEHTDAEPLPAGDVSLSAWSARVTFDNLWIFE